MLLRYVSPAALLLTAAVATAQTPATRTAGQSGPSIASLTPTSVIRGFKATTVYTDAANRPIGARFTHEKTGFILDVIRQQSVPQAHIWVKTFPLTDRGEPHTQEHLLVGKGSKGRALGTIETASLATSTAFTEQWRTDYALNTSAGGKAFYSLIDTEMDALLNPDFTDEEIRREVRSFGISEDAQTRTLSLEEKGSVYNEMVSSTATANGRLFREASGMIYGREHPLARQSGGMPEGIRELKAEDIRAFHKSHYYLANMGMIVAVPESMTLDEVLNRIGTTLLKNDRPPAATSPITSMEQLPAPQSAPEGTIRIATFPHKNPQQPGTMMFAWPATLPLSVDEQALLGLFLDAAVGDPTTNMYKLFVDTKTRTIDVGAKGVFGFDQTDEPGNPIYIGLNGVEPKYMTDTDIIRARTALVDELKRIAAFPDGSKDLQEFNDRVKSRILSTRRDYSKFVNSPPGFGFRNTYSDWLSQLEVVDRVPDFRKSLVLAPAMHFADSIAGSSANAWRTYLPKWHLTTVTPYGTAAKPDPSLIEKEDAERKARAAAEVARLRGVYGVNDDQAAIGRYKADYEKATAELDRLAASLPRTKLVDDLPMTLDDQLEYKTETVRGVPVVSSTFESMTSITAGLALRTDAVSDNELVYLSFLPSLLTRVGLVKDGVPMSYEAMSEKQRREILSLGANFSTNARTNRVELVVRGAGNDAAEGTKALGWMRDVLTAPDWRPENLPRMRDIVEQSLSALRNTQQGAPENWVQTVANAYRKQDNPRYLAATSFLTNQHFLFRLKYLLRDPGDATDRAAVSRLLDDLANASAVNGSRPFLQFLLKCVGDSTVMQSCKVDSAAVYGPYPIRFAQRSLELPSRVTALGAEISRDLEQALNDIPDGSLEADWKYLVTQIKEDLLTPPAVSLAAINALRTKLLITGNARAFIISSTATRKAVALALNTLLGALKAAPAPKVAAGGPRHIDDRVAARTPGGAKPTFVSLLDQNMQGGVMMNSVPSVTYTDTSKWMLTRFLASKLYGGGGAHSIFSQTIAAGLAYSNGIGGSATSGRLSYYAERTPELPQTLGFVVDQLKKSPHDTSLVDYAMTLVFAETRSGASFESRGEGMANDLADGQTPASVRAFRQRLLTLRKTTPNFGKALYAQMDSVYAQLLPGYWSGMPNVPGSVYFTIGAEKQQAAYEKYLKATVSPDAMLFRLYPRDFWIVTDKKKIIP